MHLKKYLMEIVIGLKLFKTFSINSFYEFLALLSQQNMPLCYVH